MLHIYTMFIWTFFVFEWSLNLTRVGTVQQSHHILGLLPQTIEEGDHQIADVLCIVGCERVLVSFDGGQGKTLALEFTPSGRGNLTSMWGFSWLMKKINKSKIQFKWRCWSYCTCYWRQQWSLGTRAPEAPAPVHPQSKRQSSSPPQSHRSSAD